jgi:hypothetical protein
MPTGNAEATEHKSISHKRGDRANCLTQLKASRRDFLKFGGLFLSTLVVKPALFQLPPPDEKLINPICKARVATNAIYRYQKPSFQSKRLGMITRDEIVNIYEEVISSDGPAYNPRWYLLADCYVHSGYLQRVEGAFPNSVQVKHLPKGGRLGEITVPISVSHRWSRVSGWLPLYRLYYQSLHWVTGIEEGPDGHPWYQLTDDLLHIHYHVPVKHIRLLPLADFRPISPDIPPEEKRIEVSVEDQSLLAYEGDQIIFRTKVSTGIPSKGTSPNGIPTDTPLGRFRVQSKMPCRHMGDGEITNDIEAYELIGVPWVTYFHKTGVAFHGTYWHDNFGRKMSHGCVNMEIDKAKWLYRWTTPVANSRDWYRRGLGTLIIIS